MHSLPVRRRRGASSFACLGLALAVAACGADEPGGDGRGTDPDVDGTLTPLVLEVQQARRGVRHGGTPRLEVSLTLATRSGSAPVPLDPALFRIKTKRGLYKSGSASTPEWVAGESCDPTISIGDGGFLRCVVAFAFPADEQAIELIYQTPQALSGSGPDQRTISVGLVVEACEPCDDDCTYLDVDPLHCGACGTSQRVADPQTGADVQLACRDAALVCPEEGQEVCSIPKPDGSVEAACVSLNSQEHCGACNAPVLDGYCSAGEAQCYDAEAVTCSGVSCTPLDSPQNCGGCGKSCEDSQPAGTSGASCGSPDENGAVACLTPVTLSTSDDAVAWTNCMNECNKLGLSCAGSEPDCSAQPTYEPIDETSGLYSLACTCYWYP